jgi:microcystin-dependent protein
MLYVPYLSQIALFAFDFAPHGWAKCSGQLLPINQNQALFALLGTTYGGNGQTTFALPDLRGHVPLGFGQAAGAAYALGETGGSESVALAETHLPPHVHTIDASGLTATARCTETAGNQRNPSQGVPAGEAAGVTATYSSALPDANMKGGAVAVTLTADVAGGGQTHDNRQPYLAMSYCIALQGIFPSQN